MTRLPSAMGTARIATVLACLLIGSGARAATVTIVPVQGLRFGFVGDGGRIVVTPHDSASRMEVQLLGTGRVTVVFELPQSLRLAAATLPLEFGSRDGRVTFPRSNAVIEFDPTRPLSFDIPADSGGARIFLGGSTAAHWTQPPGDYSAPIVVQVFADDAS
jgi:hypothetical protein